MTFIDPQSPGTPPEIAPPDTPGPDIDPGSTPQETPEPSPGDAPEIAPFDAPGPDIDPASTPQEAPQQDPGAIDPAIRLSF